MKPLACLVARAHLLNYIDREKGLVSEKEGKVALFHLGCRISEALHLEVKAINFVEGTLTVEHFKARVKLSCTQCGARLGKGHTFCPFCWTMKLKTRKAP